MLIVTGSLAYDYIMDYPDSFSDHILPDQIHNINLSFIVKTFDKRRGGTAGNASYSLALLDTPHMLFSTAGKDFDEYKKYFEDMGINVKVKTYKDTYTSTGFAMTDKGNNQIWGFFLGAGEFNDTLELKKVAASNAVPKNRKGAASNAVYEKDIVLIGPQGAKGSMSFVKQCIALDIPYLFDPGFILTQVNDEDLTRGVKHASYLIGNDYEINLIKTRVKGYEKLVKGKTIITTLGAQGALIQKDGETIEIKTAKPKEVIDPTGAGDAWRSGFLAGLMRGYDLQTCGQMGSVASSYCIEKYGTQEHTYTKKDFQTRYRKNYGTLVNL
jgi:adenosine kinase